MTATENLIAAIEAERIAEAAYSSAWGSYCAGTGAVAVVAQAMTAMKVARNATDAAIREGLGTE